MNSKTPEDKQIPQTVIQDRDLAEEMAYGEKPHLELANLAKKEQLPEEASSQLGKAYKAGVEAGRGFVDKQQTKVNTMRSQLNASNSTEPLAKETVDRQAQESSEEMDNRYKEILATLKKREWSEELTKETIAKELGLEPDQISMTEKEALSNDKMLQWGRLNFWKKTEAEHLKLPQYMVGDLALSNLTKAKSLILPRYIDGSIHLNKLTSPEGLILPRYIEGDFVLGVTTTKGLKLPEHVGMIFGLPGISDAETKQLRQEHPNVNVYPTFR